MSAEVLADTGPLYALTDPSDQFHERAHRELEMIVSRNHPVLVVFPPNIADMKILFISSPPICLSQVRAR